MLFVGCAKKHTQTSLSKVEVSQIKVADSTVIKDSVIVTPASTVTVEVTPEMLQPLTNSKGELVDNITTKKNGRSTVTVTAHANGSITATCMDDSLITVIRNLETRYRTEKSSTVSTSKEVYKTFSSNKNVRYIFFVVLAVIVVEITIRIIKKYTPYEAIKNLFRKKTD